MKTTIWLCALASIATGAPNFHEQDSTYVAQVATTPEQKSVHLDHAADWLSEVGTEDISSQAHSKLVSRQSPMEGRNFGFQKPIIIKKKIGYHLYRDSDEEMAHADPHENCRKQVKVKLCDEEPGSPKNMQCITTERLNKEISEKEIENSIKTAKEAVENLQRGFHKMEHSSAKLANTEDKEFEDDSEVHQHIEAARKALEHVQQNFGNLETINSDQGIPTKNENFQQKSSDEDRLAQWKEAIDNIQKNFEIARNIEDAFKVESEKTNELSDSSKIRESQHKGSNVNLQENFNDASMSNVKSLSEESESSKKQRDDSNSQMFISPIEQKELNINLHSDNLKSEIVATQDKDTLRTNEKYDEVKDNHELNKLKQAHESMSDVKNLKQTLMLDESINNQVQNHEPKTVNDDNFEMEQNENHNSNHLENNSSDLKLKTEKNTLSETQDTNKENLLIDQHYTNNALTLEKMGNSDGNTLKESSVVEERMDSKNNNFHNGKPTSTQETQNALENKHRSALNTNLLNDKQQIKNENVMEPKMHEPAMMRSALRNEPTLGKKEHIEHVTKPTNVVSEFQNLHNMQSKTVDINNRPDILRENALRMTQDQSKDHKLMEAEKLHNPPSMPGQHEKQQRDDDSLTSPSEEQFVNENMNMHTDMGHLSENHALKHALFMKWAQEMQQNELSQLAKTANGHNEQMSQNGGFMHRQNELNNHNNMRINQQQKMRNEMPDDPNLHDHFLMRLAQEKQRNDLFKMPSDMEGEHENRFANNFDLANSHDFKQHMPKMDDHSMMKHAMTTDMDSAMQPSMHMHHDLHWDHHNHHHHHAMARYGSTLPINGPSAVGVFPTANTGCGIPLMLSCSPSVVSGSLAKPHPATITAPAYRSGDDLMFYMKRDANVLEELPALKIQKSSIPFNHKSEMIFDKTL